MERPEFRCGLEAALNLIGGKWKLLLLYHLHGERRRFGELRRMTGQISEKVLTQQLKEMTSDGLVRRIDFKTVPPHVEYELTQFGLGLCRTLEPLCSWGQDNSDEIAAISAARAIRRAS